MAGEGGHQRRRWNLTCRVTMGREGHEAHTLPVRFRFFSSFYFVSFRFYLFHFIHFIFLFRSCCFSLFRFIRFIPFHPFFILITLLFSRPVPLHFTRHTKYEGFRQHTPFSWNQQVTSPPIVVVVAWTRAGRCCQVSSRCHGP